MKSRFLFLTVMVSVCTLCVTGCGNNSMDDPAGTGLPGSVSAKALSRHYLEVIFSQPASEAAESTDYYSITRSTGGRLKVHGVTMVQNRQRVLLTTDTQFTGETLTLTINDTNDLLEADTIMTVTATGIPEPQLDTAIALDANTVMLTMSERMDRPSTENVSFYRIFATNDATPLEDVAEIEISNAVLQASTITVLLTTSDQTNIQYTVKMTNAERGPGPFLIDPTQNTQTFFGIRPDDPVPPRLVKAESTGSTSVLLTFTEPLKEGSDDASNFTIFPASDVASAGSSGLVVTDAELTKHNTQILLTTLTQVPDQVYTVIVENVRDIARNVIQPGNVCADTGDACVLTCPNSVACLPSNTANFRGSSRELFMHSAISLSNTSVLIIFSEPMDPVGALNAAFYRIDDPDGDPDTDILIVGVAPDVADPRAIILTTTPQQNIPYTVRATNIRAIRDNFLIDPTRNSATFFGIGAQDLVGPSLVNVSSINDTSVLLTFSEPLDPDAAVPLNFTISCVSGTCINPTLLVLAAQMTSHNTQIILSTHPQVANDEYNVVISNTNGQFTDLATSRNPIDPNNNSATFMFLGQPLLEPGLTLPRVVGAISTGNTGVVITFSKPMGDSALLVSNYSIVQANVNPEVGALPVVDNPSEIIDNPHFIGPDRTAVALTTMSQNEVTYEVTVVNVKDTAGNQLAPPEILVDPSRAIFAGTPPSGSDFVDTDGDGIMDNDELRGYTVIVQLTGGEVVVMEVTSDPLMADTDGDGLGDLAERVRFSNPRSADTDTDLISDWDEVFVWGTSLINQDTDGDGIRDSAELFFFKSSPIFPDTDGDGLLDGEEILLQNRDPRISDLPDPGIVVGEVVLRLDTRFDFTNTEGVSESKSKTTSATLTQSESRTFSTSDSSTTQHAIEANLGVSAETTGKATLTVGFSYGYTRSNTFTASQSSTTDTQEQFQESLTIDVTRDVSQTVTRTVEGASVEVLVTLNNQGDIPFTIKNIELTGLLQDPFDRRLFLPVASLLPASVLEGGGEFEIFLGPFIPERGPFIFKNSEVFPSLVEDLMKNPRGLLFRVANFDIVDEDGRNFAFITQDVNDRTAGIVIDFGNGQVDRFRVSTHSRFDINECDGASTNAGAFCVSDSDCDGGSCLFSDAQPIGITMKFALQDILGLRKNELENAITVGANGCGETSAIGDDVQVFVPICPPVVVGGIIVTPGANGILDTLPAGDDEFNLTRTAVVDGGDGCAHTRASRDDVQEVPGRCEDAFPNGVMVLPGPNGTLETVPNGDDKKATITGYETEFFGVCDGNTDVFIDPGLPIPPAKVPVLETVLNPNSDDVIVGVTILPGLNGIMETVPSGNDILKGPGLQCRTDSECPNRNASPAALCKDTERIVRVKGVRNNPAEARFWVILSPVEIPPDKNFDEIVMHAGDTYSLAYVQDKDGDGLLAREEFLFGSSDNDDNTDGCIFGDGDSRCPLFSLNTFDTILDFDEVKKGWKIDVEGRRSYFAFPNPSLPDSDADGVNDEDERTLGTDPGKRDTDDDGVSDSDEFNGYEILRRDGELIRNVVKYQSAKIVSGVNLMLDTTPSSSSDDVVFMLSNGLSIITPGDNYVLDTIPVGDDRIESMPVILDGGNGIAETIALIDDVQIDVTPSGNGTSIDLTFLSFNPGPNTCDQPSPGEFNFELNVFKDVDTIIRSALIETDVILGSSVEHPLPSNSFSTGYFSSESLVIFGQIREEDKTCDNATRKAIIEPGLVILAGPDGIVNTSIGNPPRSDDVQEIPKDDPAGLKVVVISAGADGILTTVPEGDDFVPDPTLTFSDGVGRADTFALNDDNQLIGLGASVSINVPIIDCGADHVLDSMAGSPGLCDENPPRTPTACAAVIAQKSAADGFAVTSKKQFTDDEQIVIPGTSVAAGDPIVGPGTDNILQTVPAPGIFEPATGGNGTADVQRPIFPFSDDIQIINKDETVVPGQLIIAPGPDGILQTTIDEHDLSSEGIFEPLTGGNFNANTVINPISDDIQFIPLNGTAIPGALIIGPGLDGVLQTTPGDDDVIRPGIFEPVGGNLSADTDRDSSSDDVQEIFRGNFVEEGALIIGSGDDGILQTKLPIDDEIVTDNEEQIVGRTIRLSLGDLCTDCPLNACVFDCTFCDSGTCVGDDVLLDRSGGGANCEDGFCPCGLCIVDPLTVEQWDFRISVPTEPLLKPINERVRFALGNADFAPLPDGTWNVFIHSGPGCFSRGMIRAKIVIGASASVIRGAVLIRPGKNGILDTEDLIGDDVFGVGHIAEFATDPLNRDTDGDTLFDGAERALTANPNTNDADKFRDNDLDGLANIVETDGWFIGFEDSAGFHCLTSAVEETFVVFADEFNPDPRCRIVKPDPFEPDSDFDGLPDLLEFLLRSDPTNEDTDGDGLLDFDEFSPDSPFSVDLSTYREFVRKCGDAARCGFTPVEEPFGTSVIFVDTDDDGRTDREEIFECWVIIPCIGTPVVELPIEVCSDPLDPDIDRDGVLDGDELLQGLDPRNSDTDDDGKSDSLDPVPDGCGSIVTVSFTDYNFGGDNCEGSGDGEFSWLLEVYPPPPTPNFSTRFAKGSVKERDVFTFSTSPFTFLMRFGESFSIHVHVKEDDPGDGGDEHWQFTRTFKMEKSTNYTTPFFFQPLGSDEVLNDACFQAHKLQVSFTNTQG